MSCSGRRNGAKSFSGGQIPHIGGIYLLGFDGIYLTGLDAYEKYEDILYRFRIANQ